MTVQSGQTLGSLFNQLGIPASTLQRLLAEPGTKASLTHLKPGTVLGFDLPVDGQLRTLRFDRDPTHRVELSLGVATSNNTSSTVRPKCAPSCSAAKSASSLFRSARKQGLTAPTSTR